MSTITRHKGKAGIGGKGNAAEGSVPANRKKLVKSLRGSLAWVDYSVDQYLAEKHAEIERENRS